MESPARGSKNNVPRQIRPQQDSKIVLQVQGLRSQNLYRINRQGLRSKRILFLLTVVPVVFAQYLFKNSDYF